MDIFSLAVGFVVGAFTGAAGTYLGNKFTDQRRKQEHISEVEESWKALKSKFPDLINEMIGDVNSPENNGIRKFFVCKSTWSVINNEPIFSYYTDKHIGIDAAISMLLEQGYIEDITPANVPMYRMRDHFYEKLKNS